ncbi:hypothetical protein [Actinomyces wuliandei]|uniref:hypothetical protein n=1 Tax=Actinomyces wuliandei TaxID=2057743 RepID=UPI000FD82CF8|nr:hypothetical protein [Actinomyces wuliandei]
MVAVRGALRGQLRGIVIVVAVLGLLYGGLAGCNAMAARHEAQRADALAEWTMELGTLDPELMPDPEETTAQTCVDDLPCRWAVTSDTAVVMMFDDQDDACRAADSLPATVRQDQVVVQFTPDSLGALQRADLLVHIDTYDRYPRRDERGSLSRWEAGAGSCS